MVSATVGSVGRPEWDVLGSISDLGRSLFTSAVAPAADRGQPPGLLPPAVGSAAAKPTTLNNFLDNTGGTAVLCPPGMLAGTAAATPSTAPAAQLAAAGAAPANTPTQDLLRTPDGKEKVFVLHSGLNDAENSGANGIRAGLIARGVPAERIIILPNAFGSFSADGGIRRNLNNFSEFGENNSQLAQAYYNRVEQELAARGLDPSRSAVTLIGHSAGGQASLGISEVDKGRRRMVDQVITLGSPILNNAADPTVRVTAVMSDQDPIVRVTTGPLARLLGRVVLGGAQQRLPNNLDSNDRVIQVPNLDHRGYYQNPATMAMVADIALGRTPQTPLAASGDGRTLRAPGPAEPPPFFRTLLSHLTA